MKKLMLSLCLISLLCFVSNSYAQKKLTDREIFARGHVLTPQQIKIADKEYLRGFEQILYTVEAKKTETIVTFLQPIYFDSQWLLYTRGYTIIDKKTGEKYPAIGYADETIPIDRITLVRGYNRRMIYLAMKFPPLKRGVKNIDLVKYPVEENPSPASGADTCTEFRNINLKQYSPKAVMKNESKAKYYR